MNKSILRFILPLVLAAVVSACGSAGLREGREMISQGQQEAGLARLKQGLSENPDDRELRNYFLRQREATIAPLLARADAERSGGRLAEAESIYRRVLLMDESNQRAKDGVREVDSARRYETLIADAEVMLKKGDEAGAEKLARTVLGENSTHPGARDLLLRVRQQQAKADVSADSLKGPYTKPITLEFRETPLRSVFEVISRTSGINFVFDKDVKTDTKITIFVRNSSIDDAVRLILASNQLERKLLNENSMLIYPNTPAKIKDMRELVSKSFYLANADVKQAQQLLKTVAKIKDIFIDERLSLVVIRDTPGAVRLAEQLIESLDIAEPEVMLEVEVLEMSRNKLYELGIKFPDQIGYGKITPDVVNSVLDTSGNTISKTTTFGGALATGYIDLKNRSGLTSYVANPGLLLNLKNEDGETNLLANPRIRVRNREKAKIHIGEKVPVFTTTSTANVGVSASVNYLDVGLKLDVEPTVYLDSDVAIKVGLEVSSIAKEISGPANSLAYQIGTRTASTVLRLKNGETQILAGLISDEERSSANRLPGLGDIPLIGRLFSTQRDSHSKTEIVLLITPRIVRNLLRPETASPAMPSGTESAVGEPSLQMKNLRLRGVSTSKPSPGSTAARQDVAAVPEPVAEPVKPEGESPVPVENAAPVPPATTAPAAPPDAAKAAAADQIPSVPTPPPQDAKAEPAEKASDQ